MNPDRSKRQAALSWLFVGALVILCVVLGVLQYRWIGEVSVAARERLRVDLQGNLSRISRDFNVEITAAGRALLPSYSSLDSQFDEAEFVSRYERWRQTSHQGEIFSRIAVVAPQDASPVLRILDEEKGTFTTAEWPESWRDLRARLEPQTAGEPWPGHGLRPPAGVQQPFLIPLPLFGPPLPENPAGPVRRNIPAWLLLELNLRYVRDSMLPELVHRYLEPTGTLDYEVAVVTRASPPLVIYQSEPVPDGWALARADASVGLFEIQYDQLFSRRALPGPGPRERGRAWGDRRPGPGFRPWPRFLQPRARPEGPRPGRESRADLGRWDMYARHRAGSLELAVSWVQWRNLAVTGGVLLLIMASAGALIRFTRRAQKLAELQMNFVAGVSHELRTPLTVIHTAGYNLRGKVGRSPDQVERYGALIQRESERLKRLVEQVLRFAGSNAGSVIREPEAVSIAAIIAAATRSSQLLVEEAGCVLEEKIESGLPLVIADPLALDDAIQNLVTNAVQYGTNGSKWVGISASRVFGEGSEEIEIRVADRGPGIPNEEQKRIFEPFFRGKGAIEQQVHGTGLGLNLVKRIVEAHGGSVRVNSQPAKGSEFIVRIPAAPPETS